MLLVTPCTALAYTGVGMEVFVGPDKLPQVVEFLGPEGQKRAGPAYTAGVRLMDKVLAVDGEDAAGLGGLQGVAAALRGDDRGGGGGATAGSTVEVVVVHRGGRAAAAAGRTKAVTITRGEVAPNPRSCFVANCARV